MLSAPHFPEIEIKCRPQSFSFDRVLLGLKHELVKELSGSARLLSSWIINKWLNKTSLKIASSSSFLSLYQFV